MTETLLVNAALVSLWEKDIAWESNLYAYERMSEFDQTKWWYRAQRQAERGVPAMQALVNEFIAVRLTS